MNSFSEALRAAARAPLPPGAFLRRDRGDALFVTDAPRRGESVDWTEWGFICREANGLARLTPGAVWLSRLERRHPEPPDFLCETLRRFTGTPDADTLALFARIVKALDAGQCDPACARLVRQHAAVCLREHLPGGGLYACGLALYMMATVQPAL